VHGVNDSEHVVGSGQPVRDKQDVHGVNDSEHVVGSGQPVRRGLRRSNARSSCEQRLRRWCSSSAPLCLPSAPPRHAVWMEAGKEAGRQRRAGGGDGGEYDSLNTYIVDHFGAIIQVSAPLLC